LQELQAQKVELEIQNMRLQESLQEVKESRDRYAELYDSAPVGQVITDGTGRIQEVNATFAKMVEVEKSRLVGGSFLQCVQKDDVGQLLDHIRYCKWTGGPATVELYLTNQGGKTLPVQLMSIPQRDGNIHNFRVITAVTDLTDRKKAEDALEADLQLLKTVVDEIDDYTFAKDLEGRYVMVNPKPARPFGMESDEVVGIKEDDFLPPETAAVVHEEDRRILESGRTETFERSLYVGGVERIYITTKGVWQDNNGQVLGIFGIARDITDRRRQRLEIQERLARVREKRDDMLSILNQLQMGIAMTDENECITFLSEVGQRLFGKSHKKVFGKHWETLFHFEAGDREQLKKMAGLPPELRVRMPVQIELSRGRTNRIEVEVKDDPRDSRKKIFHFHDVTEVHALRTLLNERAQFADLVGKSKPMAMVFQQIQDVSRVDSTILIEGETGTGKEMVARAIHFSSGRKRGPFVPVNCAALSESLLESQLFGHKRGAFTGAVESHKGLFETAHGGTVFLDEIGDLSPSAQTRLLRVLQEREIVRLGETRPRRIDVRVLAATHRDLDEEVARGNFRSDLLYRVKVGRIQLPPLQERREDIPLLAGLFLRQIQAATSKKLEEVSVEAMRVFMEYGWPGNVRELRNAIEFAAIRCKDTVIQIDDLPSEIAAKSSEPPADAFNEGQLDEKGHLLEALERSGGNRALAARMLGIGRTTLYRRLARHKISTHN
jgi:PAS domain S-box-containing protein